jgi:hypothetical protein
MTTAGYPGTDRRVTFKFYDHAGAPTDPTTVTVRYRHRTTPVADATVLVFGDDEAVLRDSVGVYLVDIECDRPGRWYARGEGDGAVTAATETQWNIAESAFD